MLAYFVVRHGDVDMYDKRDGAQRNAMQPSTRCTAQRKKHIIYSCNNIYNNFSRMFFSNFFYNSPISTVVIILPSQAMHMLRGKSLKPTSAEVHGVQSPGLLRQAGATHHLSWWYVQTRHVGTNMSGLISLTSAFREESAKMRVLTIPGVPKLCIPLKLAKKLEVCPR